MNASLFKRFGTPSAAILCLLIGSAAGAATPKTTICHKPGAFDQAILKVANPKIPGHYAHGDYPVAPEVCDGLDSDCDKPIVVDNGVNCADAIACTVDSCGGTLGCQHAPSDALCDDSNAATADSCDVDTGCVHEPICAADLCYTGNAFDTFVVGAPTTPGDPYTSADSIQGSLDLASPLAADLVLASITPVSFTFADGVNTLTQGNSTTAVFQFSTNSSGEIIEWRVILQRHAPITGGGIQWTIHSLNYFDTFLGQQQTFDTGVDVLCGPGSDIAGCATFGDPFYSQQGKVENAPGVWTTGP
jgi:hypothetical protein